MKPTVMNAEEVTLLVIDTEVDHKYWNLRICRDGVESLGSIIAVVGMLSAVIQFLGYQAGAVIGPICMLLFCGLVFQRRYLDARISKHVMSLRLGASFGSVESVERIINAGEIKTSQRLTFKGKVIENFLFDNCEENVRVLKEKAAEALDKHNKK